MKKEGRPIINASVSSITGRVVSSSVLQSTFKFYPDWWGAPRSVISGQKKIKVYLDHAHHKLLTSCPGVVGRATLT